MRSPARPLDAIATKANSNASQSLAKGRIYPQRSWTKGCHP